MGGYNGSPYIATLASGVPVPGPVGPRGQIGPTGATGAQGPTGATGPMGPQGFTGPMGPTGPQGPVGPQGPRGHQGIQGPQGIPSTALELTGVVPTPAELPSPVEPGTCYYVVSTNTVFAYDGAQWIDLGLIQGPVGQTGPAGPQGATGTQGPPGATGPMGPAGPTGSQGPTGPTGPQGIGIQVRGSVLTPAQLPPTASNGDVYYVASNGHIYVWGMGQWSDMGLAAGPPGPPGIQGPEGPTGPQGPAGPAGQMQTPWKSDIEASGHDLSNVGWLTVGTADPQGANLNVVGITNLRRDMNGWSDWWNAQLTLYGVSDSRKAMFLGFDVAGNNGVIQPGIVGASWNNLLLNPAGGLVGIGTAAPQAELHVYGGSTLLQTAPAGTQWCLGIQGFNSPIASWVSTDGSGNLMIADNNGGTHFWFTQGGVASINTGPFDQAGSRLQVNGGICVNNYDDAGVCQIRIVGTNVGAPYGVLFREDSGMFAIMVTPPFQPWGGWSTPTPFQIDLASKRVGICTNPDPNYGLSVDSLSVGGNVWIGGDVELANGILHMENRVIQGVSRYEGYSNGTGIPQLYCPGVGPPPSPLHSSITNSSLMFVTDNANTLYFYFRDTAGVLHQGHVTTTPVTGG